jgi:hypothetical protein
MARIFSSRVITSLVSGRSCLLPNRELKPLDYLVFNEAVEGLGLSEAPGLGSRLRPRASCAAGSPCLSTTGPARAPSESLVELSRRIQKARRDVAPGEEPIRPQGPKVQGHSAEYKASETS